MTLPVRYEGLGTHESPRVRVMDAREVRDPSAATNPVVYQSPGHPMVPRWDAHNALSFGFYANTFVYRCVQCIAEDISGLPFRVGADPDKPLDFDTKNPLAKMLGPPPYGPNLTTSARQLWAWTIAQYIVTGRFGWELELGAGDIPVALWPLPAPYLKPVPSESGARYFDRFIFGRSGEERKLTRDQVFYHWKPRQDDWRQPESVLDAARLDISVAVMQDRYDYAFLANDSRPAAIVVYEGFETQAEDEAFKRQFGSQFRGPENAGKAAFVEADRDGSGSITGAIDVKTLGLSQKDSRSIERYSAKLRAICVAFGVPLTRLGDSSERTFSNAGEETHSYWTGLIPRVLDVADAVNIRLAPLFGDNVGWFDLSRVEALKPQKRYTIQEGVELYKVGAITGDELRDIAGEEPLGLGLLVTFAPPAEVPAIVQPEGDEQPALPAPAPAPAPLKVAASAPAVEERHAALERHGIERRARTVALSTVQVDALEQTWARTFRKLFARQAAEVIQRVESKRGRQATRAGAEPDGVFRRVHWQDVTRQEAEGLIEAVFAAGAGRVAGEFGVSFDLEAQYVREFVKARANQLAGQVTDTTYNQITDALAEGVGKGETISEIADRVRAVFNNADTSRATTIARTEVISAYNASGATVAGQLGADVVGGQQWITTEDARTRPEHAAADGEIVNIGEPFVGTGEPLAYPGDPAGSPGNIVNCRCVVAFLTPDEMDARSMRVETRAALGLLGLVRPGEFDELAFRRALREVRAA